MNSAPTPEPNSSDPAASDLTPPLPGFTAPGAATSHTPAPSHSSAPGAPQPGFGFLPGAPRPGVIPLRPLTVSEIFDGAFKAYRQNFLTMFGYSLVITMLGGIFVIIGIIQSGPLRGFKLDAKEASKAEVDSMMASTTDSISSTTLTGAGVLTAVSFVLTGIIIVVVANAAIGTKTSIGEAWNTLRPRLVALFGVTLLSGLIVLLLFVPAGIAFGSGYLTAGLPQNSIPVPYILGFLLILAGLIALFFLWPLWYFAPAVCVLEKMSPIASLRRGAALVKGRFWQVWVTALLAAIIVGVFSAMISTVTAVPIVIAAFISGEASVTVLVINQLISLVVAALLTPFSGGVAGLQYIDSRMRKEGLDVTLQQHVGQRIS